MKYPVRNSTATRRLHVAALDGGINQRDAAHLIDDRQLCDADNVWWRDGRLQMRPAFQTGEAGLRLISEPLTISAASCSVRTCATGCIVSKEGTYGEYVAAIRYLSGTENGYVAEYEISLLLADGSRIDTETLAVIDGDRQRKHRQLAIVQGTDPQKNIGIYAFIDGGRIFSLVEEYHSVTHSTRYYWAPADATIPTVLTAGRGFRTDTGSKADAGGTVLRGFNRLTKRFIAEYTTDGNANAFVLPMTDTCRHLDAVQFTDSADQYHHWNINGTQGSFDCNGQTVTVQVVGNVVRFEANGKPFAFEKGAAVNNLVLHAQYNTVPTVFVSAVSGRHVCTWFGGTGGGLNGGNRLFVGHDSELSWSAVGDPLDFPENNRATVGEVTEPITALAKQSDMLVIFKERSTYAATYEAQLVSANDLQSGAVTDLQAASALFPITPLHPFVGCDCPQTVALCDNRLVWATSQKKVYTLTAANAFSECNVLEISDMIRPKWNHWTADQMKAAVACDFDGYYLLFAGSEAAAMYYGKSSFGSLSGISAAKRAALTWYAWSFPDTNFRFVHAMNVGTAPVLLAECNGTNGTVRWATVTFAHGQDSRVNEDGTVQPIPVRGFVQTKPYDFGRPERCKRIVGVYPDAEHGQWTWITDGGAFEEHTDRLCAVMTPHLPATARFGARVAFDGAFSITGMTVIYQLWDKRKR